MKRLFFAALLLVATANFGQQTTRPIKTVEQQAIALFEASYALSVSAISESERSYYLLELIDASMGTVPPEETERWCIEMFATARRVTDRWDRVAQEKNALVRLAKVNPARAVLLFDQVEDPQADFEGVFREDVRSQAARVSIFPLYWEDAQTKKLSEAEILSRVEKMESLARHFGQTGSYPYGAMSDLAVHLAKGSPAQQQHAKDIIAEATEFFSKEPVKFRNRNREFFRLLETIHGETLLQPLLVPALRTYIDRVSDTVNEGEYKVEIENGNGEIVIITNRVEELIFRAFPIIRAAMPQEVLKSLSDKYASLSKAVGKLQIVYAGIVPWKTTEDQAQILHDRMKQELLVDQIKDSVGEKDKLPEAEHQASLLTDTSLHVVGYATIVPFLKNQGRAERAYEIYAGELTRLQEISDNSDRVEAEIALADASYSVDPDSFAANVEVAFSHALNALEEDYRLRSQLRTDQRKGYTVLARLVEFGLERGQVGLIERVQAIQNTELKVHLLVHAGKGLAPRKPKKG